MTDSHSLISHQNPNFNPKNSKWYTLNQINAAIREESTSKHEQLIDTHALAIKSKRDFKSSLQREDAAGDLLSLVEAFLWVGIVLLALEEGDVLRSAAGGDVLRRSHQNGRCGDWISHRIHSARHCQSSIYRSIDRPLLCKKTRIRVWIRVSELNIEKSESWGFGGFLWTFLSSFVWGLRTERWMRAGTGSREKRGPGPARAVGPRAG